MRQVRVLQEDVPTSSEFLYPLTTTLITATTEGAAHTIGEIRAQGIGELGRLFVGNQTARTADLTFYAVPSGASIGAANREITALSISGNTNVDLTELVGGLYAEGHQFRVFASTASALIVGGYVRVLT